jgi:hypothetical protein
LSLDTKITEERLRPAGCTVRFLPLTVLTNALTVAFDFESAIATKVSVRTAYRQPIAIHALLEQISATIFSTGIRLCTSLSGDAVSALT